MKLPSQGTAVQTDGDFAPSDFNIEISAHAFHVLSSGLYSNPFKAIVRELCCNAWDAHVEAGTTDRPFELYLPNTLAPVFKIRDFGVGLSENSIRQVYTTYFKSTKQQSDAMTGCFGLGSKSPYAYTKKFTIVSYYEGTRYHYNAIINDKGFPQLMKMSESSTTEANGLEISFSVNSEDFYDFRSAARVVLRPFTLKPIVKGEAKFIPDSYPETPILEGKGWMLFSRLEGGNICRMGNVEYPIEASRSGFSSNARKVLNLALVLDFPLGSFEMTPSRESIQWTEFSVRNINDRLEQIHDEIVACVSQKIAEASTFWEATISAWEFTHASGVKSLGIVPVWHGRSVKSTVEIPSNKGITLQKYTACAARANSKGKNSASIQTTNRVDPVQTTFYLADFPGAGYRVGNFVRDSLEEGDHIYLVSCTTASALKEFCHAIGISSKELVLASTIPKRPHSGGGGGGSGRRSRLAGTKARAFKFKQDACGSRDDFWDPVEVDLEEPDMGIYVEISRWEPVNSYWADKSNAVRSVKRYLDHAKILGIVLPPEGLIGIKSAHKSKFEEHENWKTLDQWLREEVIRFWNNNADFRFAWPFFDQGHSELNLLSYFRKLSQKLESKGLLSDSNYIVRFTKALDRVYAQESKVQPFVYIKDVVSDISHEGEGQISFVPPKIQGHYSDRIFARYPLFSMINHHSSLSYQGVKESKALAEYIGLMDEKAKLAVKQDPRAVKSSSPDTDTEDGNNENNDEDE